MASKKEHRVLVTVVSISGEVENQILTLEEGASTAQELVLKCFAVTDAIDAAMKGLAEADGFAVGFSEPAVRAPKKGK
jgi:hypothetical protein